MNVVSPPLGRTLGLDLGSRRIGVAISDAARILATPYTTIQRVGDRVAEHAEIAKILAEESATSLVVGLPLSLSTGEAGPAARAVQSEVKGLRKRLDLPVETIDERLTTVTADDYLDQMNIDHRRRKDMVDQIAAAIILQSWLDRTR